MRHQKRHLDAVQHAIEMHVLGQAHEVVVVFRAKHPAHVFPIVRHREAAFFEQAFFLHVAPVVVGAPTHTHGETRLESDGARAVITAQRHTFQADALGIDFPLHLRVRLDPVHHLAGPDFAVKSGHQVVQAQRFAGAGLVDQERRDTTRGQPARQADAVFHLLGGVQAVDLHQQGRFDRGISGSRVRPHIQARNDRVAVGNLHPLAVFARQLQAFGKHRLHACVQRHTPRRAMRLQAFGGEQVSGSAAVFIAR